MKMSQEVKKADVARYLGVSEEELFSKLVDWSGTIPFKLRGDTIVVEDV